ncbi:MULTISPECIES: hypothetical protein [unclassified Streptomyces]|uniref:hypothetical protein n=1 Tax=unclassified Streptomyces TaxID=2593676 RepID=UPI003333C8B0
MNRCQSVDDHQRRHGVKRLCDILCLSPLELLLLAPHRGGMGVRPLHLATVIDLCSHRLAGRAIAHHMRTEFVRQSMSAIGSSAGNAAAESFSATFKRDSLKGRKGWST